MSCFNFILFFSCRYFWENDFLIYHCCTKAKNVFYCFLACRIISWKHGIFVMQIVFNLSFIGLDIIVRNISLYLLLPLPFNYFSHYKNHKSFKYIFWTQNFMWNSKFVLIHFSFSHTPANHSLYYSSFLASF